MEHHVGGKDANALISPIRPRRLRDSEHLRALVQEHRLAPAQFIAPFFVSESASEPEPIQSMPGVKRHTLSSIVDAACKAWKLGIRSVILFGIPSEKDAIGTQADFPTGIVQQSVRVIKKKLPDMVVMTDVCLCEYTDHGHCGLIDRRKTAHSTISTIDNDKTLERLASTALSHARAGADVVAPSAMMDGQVAAIRHTLDEAGYNHTLVMAYSAKYASGYYGPFREAADSVPHFGDRRTYQMEPANRREAIREVDLDISEGADFVMVKPALAYLDIVREIRPQTHVPIAVYNVSGEYSMVKSAALHGWLDEKVVVLENLTAFVRAGADMIITYHALDAATWLQEQ